MKEKVLAFYKSIYPHTYHIEDAAMDCHIKGGRELDAFMDAAKELLKEGRLSFIRRDVYAFNNDTEIIEGIYKGYRKSFGFVITAPNEEDVYIAEQNKGTAMHNDKVRVRIVASSDSHHKREGVVTEVI